MLVYSSSGAYDCVWVYCTGYNNNNNNFINCKWVDTRWQWSLNMLHMYGLFALNLVVGRGATGEACSGNLEHKREPSQHLL